MRKTLRDPLVSGILAGLSLLIGCEGEDHEHGRPPPVLEPAAVEAPREVPVGNNVLLEVRGPRRRVLVSAVVCLRQGQLEQLLCRKNTKEHEAILSADVDARKIHEALLLAGATEGSPVRYQPTYRPPTGQTIQVTLEYKKQGKVVTVPARSWVKNSRTGKDLDIDWVFAGSRLVTDPFDRNTKIYLANDGDVICVSNFETALLDLPIRSPKDNAELVFEANTPRIPPVGTPVAVILEPVPGFRGAIPDQAHPVILEPVPDSKKAR
jgi:hypothetical protein